MKNFQLKKFCLTKYLFKAQHIHVKSWFIHIWSIEQEYKYLFPHFKTCPVILENARNRKQNNFNIDVRVSNPITYHIYFIKKRTLRVNCQKCSNNKTNTKTLIVLITLIVSIHINIHIWYGFFVLWQINLCGLFNVKTILVEEQ